MKVYLVFQASGDYEDYSRELKGVLSTKEKAQELKNDLDSGCLIDDEVLEKMMPEEVYYDWPEEGEFLPDGTPDPDFDPLKIHDYVKEYKGYTLEDRDRYNEMAHIRWMNYRPCVIEVWEVDGNPEEQNKRRI